MPTKNEIIADLYVSKDFNDCINKMHPDHLREDLKSEVMLILLNIPDDKFNLIENIRYYTVRIIINLIQSKTSPFFKMYRSTNQPLPEGPKEFQKEQHQDISERVSRELQEDKVKEYINNLYWYDKEIIGLYIKLGNYRAIEKETGIPWESCYSTVRRIIKKIREDVLMSQSA